MIHNYLKLLALFFVTCTFASPSHNYSLGQISELSTQQKNPKVYGQADAQQNKETLLIWEGDLSAGDKWAIYSGSCDGVLLGTTLKNAFAITPTRASNTFYVRSLDNEGNSAACGSFKFKFDTSVNSNLSYAKNSFSKQDSNPLPTKDPVSYGIYKSFDAGVSLNDQTGEIDLANTQPGFYAIYFFPNDASLGYSLTTLEVNNVGTLSIGTTTQAAEDLTDGLFTITSTAAPTANVRLTLSVTGTATGGTDYVTIPTTLIFPAGQTTVTIPVDVIPDSSLEGTETIIVTLQSTDSADITVRTTSSSATMNLSDNDSASVIITDATGNEDDGPITISASLSNAVQGGFSVDISSIDASATVADNDYTPISNQTLTFTGASGEVQTFTLSPTADADLENDETIIISMSNLTGTVLPVNITNSAIVTILNDEVDCSNAAAISANFQTFDSGCANGASGAASAVLFYDGFENAQITPSEYRDSVDPIPGLPQWRYEGAPTVNARLSVFSSGFSSRANNGSVGLGLDAGNFVPHSIILNVDLSQQAGEDDLMFSYSFYNSGDENTPEDLISIRGDITDPWVTLSDWNDGSRNRWITREADIDAVLTAAGQTVSANTEIRFTQSDNFQFSSDGVIFDDVMIYKEGYTYLWSNNETTGVIQDLQPGNYSVVITSPEGCSTTLNGAVGGIPADDSSFTYSNASFCQNDTNISPTITGLPGGTFTSSPFGLALDSVTGEIDFTNSIAGRSYIVTYQTNGSCPSFTDFPLAINFPDNAFFVYSDTSYSLADPVQFPSLASFGGAFTSSPNGLALDPVSGAIEPVNSTVGTYTVTYTTSGTCPAVSTQTITILNADIVAPIARCQPFVGQLDADGLLTIEAFNVDAGSTDDVSIASLTVSQTSFSCNDVGVNNVTLTVTDTSGNQSTCTTTVTVEDVDAPVLQCTDITLELDANGQASLNDGSFSSDVDYDVTSIPLGMETLTSETTVTLSDDQVTPNIPVGFDFDYFGNTYSTFRISSNGFIGFGGLNNNGCCQGLDLESGNVNPSNIVALAWTDLNPAGSPNIGYQTIGTAPNRKLVVNFSNTPSFGGSANVTGQIHLFEGSGRIEIHNVSNNINTVQTQGILNADSSVGIPVPGRNAQVWNATNDAWAFTPANVFATDNCTLTDVTVSKIDFTCADLGVNSVSISATDASGNTSNCSFFVTVVDNTAPLPAIPTLPDVVSDCQVTSLTPPVVADNCASTVSIINNANLPITNQGTTVVTWFYSDGNGNFSFQNQNVVINDVTPPVPDVTNLPDVIAACDVTTLSPPTATEASCANGDVTITGTTNASLPITSSGTTVVTWTYTDANGNFVTQDQNVVIDDNIAPIGDVASLPDLVDQCAITALTPPTATDNCSPTVTVTSNAVLPITSTSTIIWSYEDANGNIATQNQQVVISDTLAPTADVATLSDITSDCEVTSLTAPTATDNCSAVVSVTNDITLPINTQGTTVITWTYTDGNGNSSTQTQNVIITDSIAPVADVSNLTDVIADCEVTTITPPTASDNCVGAITAVSDVSFPLTAQGTTVVTWTYSDGNGNSSTQTQNVIIADTIAPVPNIATLSPVTSECAITSITAPSAVDNCSGVIFATNDATLPITSGTTTVTYTYDDGNGNITTQTQQITVNDITAPIPDVANLPDLVEQCEITSLTPPTATDNCSATVTVTNDATLPLTAASTVVTWSYDDGNGNIATQTQNVIINDTTAPSPDLTDLPDVLGQCEVTSLTPPTATDNCSGTVTVTNDAVLPITAASTIVTWTYDDGNGNAITQTQTVIVNDDTAPIATCPQDVVVAVRTTDYAVLDYTTALNATDNCSDSSALIITQSIAPGTLVSVPSITPITVTITDENGNDQVCTFQLRVDQDLSNGGVDLEGFSVKIYPNPTQGELNISSEKERIESIELIDFRGRLVKTWRVSSLNETQISISEFESAIYFVRIKTENHVINKRVIKD